MLSPVFKPFIEESPISVMARGMVERVLNPKQINKWFDSATNGQYTKDLLFSTFLKDNKNNELPQHNKLFMDMDPVLIFKKAATVLDFDIESSLGRYMVSSKEKEKRDILIYLLWKTGRMSNQNIGSLLGITYSAVSKIISAFSAKIQKDKRLTALSTP